MKSGLFESIIGQADSVELIKGAVQAAHSSSADQAFTHAWLFTGPPGSGRSNLAKAFAAALLCANGGCGSCVDCTTALLGTHQDIEILQVKGVNIKVDEVREAVSRAAWGAAVAMWRAIVIEDCDRMTEAAANSLLKSLEDAGSQTVWLLSAPSVNDVLPTIRSRCRHIQLRTPKRAEVANFLSSELGLDQSKAELIAWLAQGHIGKARSLAQESQTLELRKRAATILTSATNEASAIKAAANLLTLAEEAVESRNEPDSEKSEKSRRTRSIKDELDGMLIDYLTIFRDSLAAEDLTMNRDLKAAVTEIATSFSVAGRIEVVAELVRARERLMTNAAHTLTIESLFLHLAAARVGK